MAVALRSRPHFRAFAGRKVAVAVVPPSSLSGPRRPPRAVRSGAHWSGSWLFRRGCCTTLSLGGTVANDEHGHEPMQPGHRRYRHHRVRWARGAEAGGRVPSSSALPLGQCSADPESALVVPREDPHRHGDRGGTGVPAPGCTRQQAVAQPGHTTACPSPSPNPRHGGGMPQQVVTPCSTCPKLW